MVHTARRWSGMRRAIIISLAVFSCAVAVGLSPARGQGNPAAKPRISSPSPEETARYEAGLRAARKFLEGRDKAASREKTPGDYAWAMEGVKDEFLESLRQNGREGAEAAEFVALVECRRRKRVIPGEFWVTYVLYLEARAGDWGRPHLNALLQSDQLTLSDRATIMEEFIRVSIEPANWLDEAAVLPIIQSFLKNTEYYGFIGGWAGEEPLDSVHVRYCDLGVRLAAGLYHPPGVKWIDIDTPLSKEEAQRQRDENVEAAKAWVQAQLARAALRPQLLEMVSSYWRYRLTRGQIETLLDLWAALESRPAAGNIRDVRALSDLLIADLRRTADADRDALEKEFHRLVHDRLAGMLAKAGYQPEGPATRLPRNHVDQREWLRNAVHHLARARGGAPPDQWMRYEWERYLDELRDAAQADHEPAKTHG